MLTILLDLLRFFIFFLILACVHAGISPVSRGLEFSKKVVRQQNQVKCGDKLSTIMNYRTKC